MQLQALERRSTFTSSYASYISHEVSLLYSHNTQHCSSYRLQKVTFLPLQQERAFIMVINSAVECHAPALQWKDCDITLYYYGSGRCTGFDLEVKLQLFHSGYASTHTSNLIVIDFGSCTVCLKCLKLQIPLSALECVLVHADLLCPFTLSFHCPSPDLDLHSYRCQNWKRGMFSWNRSWKNQQQKCNLCRDGQITTLGAWNKHFFFFCQGYLFSVCQLTRWFNSKRKAKPDSLLRLKNKNKISFGVHVRR